MFLVALLVGLCMPTMAQTQTSYTFNVASLNVEGVPQTAKNDWSLNQTIQENALESGGTKVLSSRISNLDWGIIGLCEDYNFHTELMSSLSTKYTSYPKGNDKISDADDMNATYGLGVLTSKSLSSSASLGTRLMQQRWSGGSGANILEYTANGEHDNRVYRGFECYPVTLATGVVVDVYVLHMDAGLAEANGDYYNNKDKNVIARENQLSSLAAVIKSGASRNRPIIVMGMTNSLYTREAIKTKFIDVINQQSNLSVSDAWVELVRGGVYPVYGTEDEEPGTNYYDDQTGEVVNKIFYINNINSQYRIRANSYFRDVTTMSLRNMPVVVNFTVVHKDAANGGTVTLDKTIAGLNGEQVKVSSDWIVNNGVIQTITASSNTLKGDKIAATASNAKTYFLKNVATGAYLKSGANWGTQACEGSAGMPITIKKVSSNSNSKAHTLATLGGKYVFIDKDNPNSVFMDGASSYEWNIEQVNGSSYQYIISKTIGSTKYALSSTGDVDGRVWCKAYDANDDCQKWALLTESTMPNYMSGATIQDPYDITPLIQAASFDRMDVEYANTSFWDGYAFHYGYDGSNQVGFAYHNATNQVTVTKTMSNMPIGTYQVSFEGFYRARYMNGFYSPIFGIQIGRKIETSLNATVQLGGNSANFIQNTMTDFGDITAGDIFVNSDKYKTQFTTTQTSKGNLVFKVNKPAFTQGPKKDRKCWIALDNIVIKYLGNTSNQVKVVVANYINQTALKVAELNAAGQAAYDISVVLARYNANPHQLSSDGSMEIAMIDAAYEIALRAHNKKLTEDAVKENGGDVTSLIVNPSFEYNNGSTYGWTQAPASLYMDANCAAGGEVDIDGTYRFNAWCAGPVVTPIMQTVTGLKNGLYELKALIASDAGNVVYLIGNDSHIGKVAVGGNEFVESTLEFLVEDGTAKIGAVGGYDGHFYITGGWYKVDNFRLKYICDPAHGRVYLAHKEASAVYETLDNFGKDYADGKAEPYPAGETPLNTLLTTYKNANTTQIASLSKSSGVDEAAAIYSALSEAAFRQKTVGADMTWCFGDPSFEIGKYSQYWSVASGDTWGQFLAARQDDKKYAAVGVEGSYMLNFYDWTDSDALITTIGANSRIPNGIYEVTALVTSDNGCNVFIEAEGDVSEPVTARDLTNADGAIVLPAGSRMFPIKHQFEVTDGTATIKVYAENSEGNAHNFFKVDDFHLHIRLLASYQEPTEKYENNNTLYLDENSTEIPDLPVLTKSVENTNFQYNRVEITRGISNKKWSTLVVPFDMPVSALGDGNWDVRELTNAEVKTIIADDGTKKEDVVISFTTPTDNTIKMGKCYIVRHETQSLSTVVMDAGNDVIAINTSEFDNSFNTANNKLVEFVGTYTNGFVPAGSYFISNNLFKKAVNENTNKIKGFRAYFNVKTSAGARGLSFRVGESTDIESANNDEVTIVGIYNLSGMRLNDMEPGVNILHMSDGTSVKVIIK